MRSRRGDGHRQDGPGDRHVLCSEKRFLVRCLDTLVAETVAGYLVEVDMMGDLGIVGGVLNEEAVCLLGPL